MLCCKIPLCSKTDIPSLYQCCTITMKSFLWLKSLKSKSFIRFIFTFVRFLGFFLLFLLSWLFLPLIYSLHPSLCQHQFLPHLFAWFPFSFLSLPQMVLSDRRMVLSDRQVSPHVYRGFPRLYLFVRMGAARGRWVHLMLKISSHWSVPL